uniref:U1 small nuclear ribonucleoprotein C n=1 Tax=Oryzias melastigma TaxID=30732 RepID=A0A3B3DH11_ORYME
MPKFYCDYCDTYLTHDSPSVRKTHCSGRKHKENVKDYYQKWMEEQAQSLIDKTTAAFQQGKIPPTPFPGGPPPAGPPRPGMLPTPPMGGPPMMPMMGPPPHGMMPGGPGQLINVRTIRDDRRGSHKAIPCSPRPHQQGCAAWRLKKGRRLINCLCQARLTD